ncbi:MAG: hypothetical protein F4137_21345 [Acidobacteria bacterium]|nr:hypothetical protein [Acidobacteriota bacterium]
MKDLATGMEEAVRSGAALAVLRMDREMHEIPCPTGRSLRDACFALVRLGMRDEAKYFMRLGTKVPLQDDVSPEAMEGFVACEATACEVKQLSQADGAPLILCAATDGIAVGFPSHPVWDRDRMTVVFRDPLGGGDSEPVRTDIDHFARPEHARAIIERRRAHLRTQCSDPGTVWQLREQLFPSLLFGPDVEEHLKAVARVLPTVVKRLAQLDDTASTWPEAGGTVPPWPCVVTPESPSTMNDPSLRKARYFRSADRERRLFEWHARFGSGMRIHLRYDPRIHEIEIGYIGPKLPTRRK